MTDWHRWEGADLLLDARVQPRASRDAFVPEGDRLRIRTTAPPLDGAANEHLCRWLAKEFGVAASRVSLVRGATGREKSFRIAAPERIPSALATVVQPPRATDRATGAHAGAPADATATRTADARSRRIPR